MRSGTRHRRELPESAFSGEAFPGYFDSAPINFLTAVLSAGAPLNMTEGKGLEWHENLREKQRILGHSSTAVLGCAPAGPEPLAASIGPAWDFSVMET